MIRQKEYPFSAIVGQELMKKALILNLINPSIGGVLIRGEKGTAKSTTVRALVQLMQPRLQVKGCKFNCMKTDEVHFCSECEIALVSNELEYEVKDMNVIELPVSATEDRVVGTLDIEAAIKDGKKVFEPGILAAANNNILYVDEINLLDDHVIDILLDSAAMGVNIVEREGISYIHPAKFILVGTMNPEEGDLRPQLLDRFGMLTDVVGEQDVKNRSEIVKRRLAFEFDRDKFLKDYEVNQNKIRKDIEEAKEYLKQVDISDDMIHLIAKISIELDVDGHRADITMVKTAMTIAAFDKRTKVTIKDISEAAKLVLPHRMRRKPFEDGVLDEEVINQIIYNKS